MHFALNDLEISIYLGVPIEERKKIQIIRIDAGWSFETAKSEKSDDINDTVDYFQVEQLIRRFTAERSWHLLEKLHGDLKRKIETIFPTIENLKLTITKYPFINGSVCISD